MDNTYPEIRNIREWMHQKGLYVCIPDSDEISIDSKWGMSLMQNNYEYKYENPIKAFHVFIDSSNADMELFKPDRCIDLCSAVRAEFIQENDDSLFLLLTMSFEGLPGKYDTLWELTEEISPYLVCFNTKTIMWKYSFDKMMDIVSSLTNLYKGVQYYFSNKPQFFRQFHKRNSFNEIKKAEKAYHSKKHVCKIQKIIYICDDETRTVAHSVYSCERWSVSGHYRTYKSGKRIWVHPYEKGKKRNDNNANFVSKRYTRTEKEKEV